MGVFPAEYLLSAGLKDYPILQLHSLHPDFNAIKRDDEDALKIVIRRIYEQGWRKIVVAAGPLWTEIVQKNAAKYGLQSVAVPLDFFSSEKDFDRVRDLAPDVVICSSSIHVVPIQESYQKKKNMKMPYFFYSYTLPCDCIVDSSIAGVVVPDFKEVIHMAVFRMIQMLEDPEKNVIHLKTPVRFLEREQMLKFCGEQLADPFYEPFTMKLKYKQKGFQHE